MAWLLGRAVLSFVVLPGTVAFLVPLALADFPGSAAKFDWRSLSALVPGIALLLACVREFYTAGRGTLGPWEPPSRLVTTGAYRLSRNPMYLAVVLVLWGWALGFGSRPLVTYALAFMLVFHLRVVFVEEPWLARTHGEAWDRYKARVPRWLGPVRAGAAPESA
jgi:protein-S-isoprenylcysteine O-methyltransferase Ste14